MKILYDAPDLVVAEMEPSIRTVIHEYDHDIRYFRISFPYLLFKFTQYTFDRSYFPLFSIYCRTRPLKGERDAVYRLPLPNVYPDGRCCNGDHRELPIAVKLIDAVPETITKFWSTPFTYALRNGYQDMLEGLESMEKLANKTKRNSFYWKDFPFVESATPLFNLGEYQRRFSLLETQET